ncbi:RDD family protein [Calothrix sp. 336/3]|uniref:RDD family protein n=1 Tax=Calothrix sp. 336/3 TaxID=1337936 RepID=UPI0004E2A861|nr:RDD family protein [Calothrix sp. 336/3]AKG24339.1 RDD domain-containing protein [Calothrix sp. 336/3]
MHIFNKIKYRTPESVELEFVLAGIGSRSWALIIDYQILGIILIGFLIVWSTVSLQLIDWLGGFVKGDKIANWLTAIFILIYYSVYSGYFVFFETIWQGQTPGKRIAKIRVIRDNGRPVSLLQSGLRALLRPIDDTLFLGAFFIAFSRREKRLGDWVAGTVVIQSQAAKKPTRLQISESSQAIAEELSQTSDLSTLLPDDFAVVREYLLRREGMSAKARSSVAKKLSSQLKAILHLENFPSSINHDIFLEAIYLAYQNHK